MAALSCQVKVMASLAVLAAPVAAETLTLLAPVAENVAALPRLTGDTETSRRINLALDELDTSQLFAITCDDDNLEDAFRSVEILSDGPAYLSLIITTGGYCAGAAHPWGSVQIVNFDLASGKETSLTEYLPVGWSNDGRMTVPLLDFYLANLDRNDLSEDCLDSLSSVGQEGSLWFALGIDTASHRLVLLPDGLPYVASGCEAAAWIEANALRRAGFDPRLVRALGVAL